MIVSNNYIIATQPHDANYNEILAAIAVKPADPEGYQYRLRADTLEWELAELPPEPEPGDEDIDDNEALAEILEVLQ